MTSDRNGTVAASRLVRAVAGERQDVPPIWCMRQAGRYQDSYQDLRRRHSFEALCREPDLAARVALNAVDELDFDAAILFSDLLFPLDAIGLPVSYDDGPKLARRLDDSVLDTLRDADTAMADLAFQAAAVAETRAQLPDDRGLIGFIGGPWTLFVYAVEGTHTGTLTRAKTSLPLYRRFASHVGPLLERMARAQLDAGADLVMVFDTAAGDLSPAAFQQVVAPDLARLAAALPQRLGYYARGLHPAHLDGAGVASIGPWAGLGLDWRWNLADALAAPARRGFVQGNLDPSLLHLSGSALARALDEFLDPIAQLDPADRRGWICGLGHGVLQGTPPSSVKAFVHTVRKRLA
ncbi:MAG TPA: uroporphyrinogen decarboxylase family protein [Vicinamibacterales bacterium]|jgi:uroporphyrinogen decarboxylase|nr:uroporphyrinogen decarboxylase family protein [Vicinamibacterales bacterium]